MSGSSKWTLKVEVDRTNRTSFVAASKSVKDALLSRISGHSGGAGSMVLKLKWGSAQTAFVGFRGDRSCNEGFIRLSRPLLRCFDGLVENSMIEVTAVSAATCQGTTDKYTTVPLDPLSYEDWEIIEHNAGVIEEVLLDQIDVINDAFPFPVQIADTTIHLRSREEFRWGFVQIGRDTSVDIRPLSKSRKLAGLSGSSLRRNIDSDERRSSSDVSSSKSKKKKGMTAVEESKQASLDDDGLLYPVFTVDLGDDSEDELNESMTDEIVKVKTAVEWRTHVDDPSSQIFDEESEQSDVFKLRVASALSVSLPMKPPIGCCMMSDKHPLFKSGDPSEDVSDGMDQRMSDDELMMGDSSEEMTCVLRLSLWNTANSRLCNPLSLKSGKDSSSDTNQSLGFEEDMKQDQQSSEITVLIKCVPTDYIESTEFIVFSAAELAYYGLQLGDVCSVEPLKSGLNFTVESNLNVVLRPIDIVCDSGDRIDSVHLSDLPLFNDRIRITDDSEDSLTSVKPAKKKTETNRHTRSLWRFWDEGLLGRMRESVLEYAHSILQDSVHSDSHSTNDVLLSENTLIQIPGIEGCFEVIFQRAVLDQPSAGSQTRSALIGGGSATRSVTTPVSGLISRSTAAHSSSSMINSKAVCVVWGSVNPLTLSIESSHTVLHLPSQGRIDRLERTVHSFLEKSSEHRSSKDKFPVLTGLVYEFTKPVPFVPLHLLLSGGKSSDERAAEIYHNCQVLQNLPIDVFGKSVPPCMIHFDCRRLISMKIKQVLYELKSVMYHARSQSPSVLVLHELDSLIRSQSGEPNPTTIRNIQITTALVDMFEKVNRLVWTKHGNFHQNRGAMSSLNTVMIVVTAKDPSALCTEFLSADCLGSFHSLDDIPVVSPLLCSDRREIRELSGFAGGKGTNSKKQSKSGNHLRSNARMLTDVMWSALNHWPQWLPPLIVPPPLHSSLNPDVCFDWLLSVCDSTQDCSWLKYCDSTDIRVFWQQCCIASVSGRSLRSSFAKKRNTISEYNDDDEEELKYDDNNEDECDFQVLMKQFDAPSMRSGKEVKTTEVDLWSKIGGLSKVKRELLDTYELPTLFPTIYSSLPLKSRSGVLLTGPSGCGKTMIATAVAKKCGLSMISVKGPELLNKYIGASEAAVRDVFMRAAACAPCILFFDEFESLAPRRGSNSTAVTDRVVNQLLTFLDGVEGREGVYVLAASSRPDLIDLALLRPGRLDKKLFCGIPDLSERRDIIRVLSQGLCLDKDVNLDELAEQTDLLTGADLSLLFTTAHTNAYHKGIEEQKKQKKSGNMVIIDNEVIQQALKQVSSDARYTRLGSDSMTLTPDVSQVGSKTMQM